MQKENRIPGYDLRQFQHKVKTYSFAVVAVAFLLKKPPIFGSKGGTGGGFVVAVGIAAVRESAVHQSEPHQAQEPHHQGDRFRHRPTGVALAAGAVSKEFGASPDGSGSAQHLQNELAEQNHGGDCRQQQQQERLLLGECRKSDLVVVVVVVVVVSVLLQPHSVVSSGTRLFGLVGVAPSSWCCDAAFSHSEEIVVVLVAVGFVITIVIGGRLSIETVSVSS